VLPMAATLVFQIVGLHDFGRQYDLRIRWHHYAKLVLGSFPYALVLSTAALRAVWREYTGKRNWELTTHVGAHLSAARPATEVAA
jgi:glycosyltransferase XagB